MPNVRKLSVDEVRAFENRGKGQRKIIEEEYDTFLGEYSPGDYGEAELISIEKRLTVRNRFKAAANRRGVNLEFQRTKGNTLRFRILAGDPSTSKPAKTASSVSRRGQGRRKQS